MYILLVTACPLAFFALRAAIFPPGERAEAFKTYARGVLLFLPLYVVWNLARRVVPAAHGGLLAIFRLSWEHFLLPVGLAGASYGLFARFRAALESASRGRAWFAHVMGVLSPLGLAVMIERYGTRNGFTLLAWPLMLPAFAAFAVFAAAAAYDSFGAARVGIASAAVLFGVAMAIPALLFAFRLELPGFAVAAAAAFVAGYFGLRRLMERREPARAATGY